NRMVGLVLVFRFATTSEMSVAMKVFARLFVCVFLLTVATFAQSPSIAAPPETPKRPVTDEYQGVKVVDDYRWLEYWDEPQVKQWSAAQQARPRRYPTHVPS